MRLLFNLSAWFSLSFPEDLDTVKITENSIATTITLFNIKKKLVNHLKR